MKILTAAEMREVDRLTAVRGGVPSLSLMENAGARVFEFLASRFPDFARRKIVVLCGKGNNGGDGFVVARQLRDRGARPQVILCGDPEAVAGDAAASLKRWREAGGELLVARTPSEWDAAKAALASANIIVDALLGTGLHGPAEGLCRKAIEDVNRHDPRAVVVAVDIPSGLSADSPEVSGPAIFADYTITFTAPKVGLVQAPASDFVGRLNLQEIGSPRELIEEVGKGSLRWMEADEFRELPFQRKPNTNKGDYGHALLVAGSRGKTGAAVLAAWAALRAGAGLVSAAIPESVLPIVAAPVPEVMTEPLAATDAGTISLRALEHGRFNDLLKGMTVVAMGPGLSAIQETQQFIRTVVREMPHPLILDADGLNAFAGRASELKRRATPLLTLTPHPGEMARLLDSTSRAVQERRLDSAKEAAADWNACVVLKGYATVVAAPDGRAWINSTGNPGMATGGTGDVLTGILAGLAAQFAARDWPIVMALGVYLHGLAGDLAAAETGEAPLMASDLIRAIPRAWAHVTSEIARG